MASKVSPRQKACDAPVKPVGTLKARMAYSGGRLSSSAAKEAAKIIRNEMDQEATTTAVFGKKVVLSDQVSEDALKIYAELNAEILQETKDPKAYTQRRSTITDTWLDKIKEPSALHAANTPNHTPDSGLWELGSLFTVHKNRLSALNLMVKWATDFAKMKAKYNPPKLQSAATRPGPWLLAGFHQEDIPEGPRHHSTLFKKTHSPYNDDFTTFLWHCIDAVARENTVKQCWMIYVGLLVLPGVIPNTIRLENSLERVQDLFSNTYDPVKCTVPDSFCVKLFEAVSRNGVWDTISSVLSNINISLVSHLSERPQVEFAGWNQALSTKNLLSNIYTYSKLGNKS